MHLLSVDQEFLIHRVVVMLPESIGVVADITAKRSALYQSNSHSYEAGLLDRHEADAGQNAHDAEQLPELDILQQSPAPDIYTMRTVHINTALH